MWITLPPDLICSYSYKEELIETASNARLFYNSLLDNLEKYENYAEDIKKYDYKNPEDLIYLFFWHNMVQLYWK